MNSIPFTRKLLTSLSFLFPLLALCLSNLDPTLRKIQPSHWKEDSAESFNCGSFSKISRYFMILGISFQVTYFSHSKYLSDCTQGPKGTVTIYPYQLTLPEKLQHQKDQELAWSKTFSQPLYQQLFINSTVIYPTTTFSHHQTDYNFNFHCLSFLVWATISG